MNPNNSIQYLMEAHLSAYKVNDSPQDSYFSTEYNLFPVKELSCSDKMQENLTLYKIAIDDIFMKTSLPISFRYSDFQETHNIDAASKRVIAENDSDQNDEDLNKNFMGIIANQT